MLHYNNDQTYAESCCCSISLELQAECSLHLTWRWFWSTASRRMEVSYGDYFLFFRLWVEPKSIKRYNTSLLGSIPPMGIIEISASLVRLCLLLGAPLERWNSVLAGYVSLNPDEAVSYRSLTATSDTNYSSTLCHQFICSDHLNNLRSDPSLY